MLFNLELNYLFTVYFTVLFSLRQNVISSHANIIIFLKNQYAGSNLEFSCLVPMASSHVLFINYTFVKRFVHFVCAYSGYCFRLSLCPENMGVIINTLIYVRSIVVTVLCFTVECFVVVRACGINRQLALWDVEWI